MTSFDPRYDDDLPEWVWRPRGWAWRIIAVGNAVFWIVVGLGVFIAITAR